MKLSLSDLREMIVEAMSANQKDIAQRLQLIVYQFPNLVGDCETLIASSVH